MCTTPGGSQVSHAVLMRRAIGVVGHRGKTCGFSSLGWKWIDYQIAVKELLPSMCCMGTPMVAQVLVLCDIMAVVQVIAAQTSKEPVLMHLIRCLHFFCKLNDNSLRCEHIPGVHNVIADSLYHNNDFIDVFHTQLPLQSWSHQYCYSWYSMTSRIGCHPAGKHCWASY